MCKTLFKNSHSLGENVARKSWGQYFLTDTVWGAAKNKSLKHETFESVSHAVFTKMF